MRRFRIGCPLLLLVLAPAAASPLPNDVTSAKRVTLSVRAPLPEVLRQVSRSAGVGLSVEDPGALPSLTVQASECSLRDLMDAIAGAADLDWGGSADDGYVLRAPSFCPPAMDTRRLIGMLTSVCPGWMRPLADPAARLRDERLVIPLVIPYLTQIYTPLTPALRDVIEDGGEVAFPELPLASRRAITQYCQHTARQQVSLALNPRWYVPPESLALVMPGASAPGVPFGTGNWALVVRVEPPAPMPSAAPSPAVPPPAPSWQLAGTIPYRPPLPGAPADASARPRVQGRHSRPPPSPWHAPRA